MLNGDAHFLLWVDAVGGFLVCCGDEIVLGQAVPGNRVDIPLLADLSRQHARICREDGYFIEPLRRVCVEGREIDGPTVLADGDEIELGKGVRLRFRQPHALSATARLEFVSRHRTQPTVDAVLLMAESCVLGPNGNSHVVCRPWSHDVVFYRRDGRLYCRARDGLEIDGRFCHGEGLVHPNSHVVGTDFSLSLESVKG
ncbi:MAG: FHA domain-containing protein [Planctomycetota bacterium]|nr:FHA domain-containing protein [Planctomycetota bacterium]